MQLEIVKNVLVLCSSSDIGITMRRSDEMDVRKAVRCQQYVHRMVNAWRRYVQTYIAGASQQGSMVSDCSPDFGGTGAVLPIFG